MKLRDLVGPEFPELAPQLTGPDGETGVTSITADSRKVAHGSLFVAVQGTRADGATYVADAIAKGAKAVVVGTDTDIEAEIPVLKVDDTRRFLSLSAARLFSAQPDVMIAVTGTAGKTSVASFTRQIWAHAGFSAAMIGTTGIFAPDRVETGSLTTPDPVTLHQVLSELSHDGVTHAAMEASSHGLDQRRLDGVRLTAAAFTNLGRDHMDYHPTVENYLAAKLRLFRVLAPKNAPAVVFADDKYSEAVADAAREAGLDVKTVGRKGDFLTLKRVEHFRHKQSAEIHCEGEIYEVDIPLAGDFQVSNALVAAGLAMATGVSTRAVMAALEKLTGASGRLELVGHTEDGALAYVDYAHKPEALENVLESVRPFTTGRVIVVFGCGGDRDRLKRPIMGEIAKRLADVVIVTDDNPRSEDPATIRSEILMAVPGAEEIADRAEAIRTACSMLTTGDTLIVAGKGHEEGQYVGDKVLPFSDHVEIEKALGMKTERQF